MCLFTTFVLLLDLKLWLRHLSLGNLHLLSACHFLHVFRLMGTFLVSLFYGGLLVPALLFFFNHVWHLNRALIARVVAHVQVTVVGTGHWILITVVLVTIVLITVAGYWLVNRLVHGLVDGHHHVFADGGIH